jgi:hypothetical protein
MTFVLNGTLFKVYIDGKEVNSGNNAGFLSPGFDSGSFGLGMVSGNTNGYGFRVKMTNAELWEIADSGSAENTPGTPSSENPAVVETESPNTPGAAAATQIK